MRFFAWTLCAAISLSGSALAEDDWYPSQYGAEDRLGSLNKLSPEMTLEAVKLVRTGKTYALGVETGPDTPAFGVRSYQMVVMPFGDGSGNTMGPNKMTFNDEWMAAWLGIGTQLDGLGHLGIDHRYYNGVHSSEFFSSTGVTQFATHTLPPIVARGVLLDIAALEGVKMLSEGTAINRDEIQAAAKKQKVELRDGDVVIFNTGWQALASEDPERFLAGEPGLGIGGAEYLAEIGVLAVGADTFGVEVLPFEKTGYPFTVHQFLLAKNGIYILENIRTDELAADRAWEFLFVLGAPRFVGAVQMVVNPVAIR